MKETHVELCCCGAWFATDTFALKARAEEVAAFREAHKVCRERHVKGIPSKPPAGDRTAGSMSQDKAATKRVGICWADYETFWWNATDEPVCPACVEDDEGYVDNHGFFVPEVALVALAKLERYREALRAYAAADPADPSTWESPHMARRVLAEQEKEQP